MMSLRPAGSRVRGDGPILPLINIVFLLLIFFMLAGRFAATDPFDLEPPQSISKAGDDPDLIIVQFGQGGEVAIDGEIIAIEELDRALEVRFSAEPPRGVRIKAHGVAAAPDVIELITRLGDAGVKDLKLMTVARQP